MANILCTLFWFIILVTVAFPIAFFCSGWYVVIYPFSRILNSDGVSISRLFTSRLFKLKCFQVISDSLLKGVQLPGTCVENMINCEGFM